MNTKYEFCYIMAMFILDPISLLCYMIQKECSEPDLKIPLLFKILAILRLLNVD